MMIQYGAWLSAPSINSSSSSSSTKHGGDNEVSSKGDRREASQVTPRDDANYGKKFHWVDNEEGDQGNPVAGGIDLDPTPI